MIATEHEASSRRARRENRRWGKQAGKSIKKSPSSLIPPKKGRRGGARAIERQNKAAHTTAVPRIEKQKETHRKAREILYPINPEAINREQGATHNPHNPSTPRTRQASRPTREGDGNRKERKNGNHRTSEAANILRPVRFSSSHPTPHEMTPSSHPPPSPHSAKRLPDPSDIVRSAPPRSTCRRAGRNNTASKQRRHMITPSRRHPSASSHPPPHRQAEADNRTGNRDRHGTPRT